MRDGMVDVLRAALSLPHKDFPTAPVKTPKCCGLGTRIKGASCWTPRGFYMVNCMLN